MVRARLKILIAILFFPPLVILGRLAWLQLHPGNHGEYFKQSQHRTNIFSAPIRGRILARDGRLLAANRPVYRLGFHYPSLNPRAEPLSAIAAELEKRRLFKRDAIEARLLELANPRALASGDPSAGRASGPEWLRLVEGIDAVSADVLKRVLRKHTTVFQVKERPGSKLHDLCFDPRRAAHMEIVLHRLARILADSGGPPPDQAYAELLRGVEREMARVERLVAKDLELDEKERDRSDDIQKRRLSDYIEKKRLSSRKIHLEKTWVLAESVPPAAATEVEYYPGIYDGLHVEDGIRRTYPLGEAAGTLTGYLGYVELKDFGSREIDPDPDCIEQCGKLDATAFDALRRERELRRAVDPSGLGGLERRYDAELRGLYGLRVVSVDLIHRPTDLLEDLAPVHGEDLRTTIDAPLQVSLYEALRLATLPHGGSQAGTAASAAVMSLRPGERGALLASAGFPGVDPNRLMETPQAYMKELEDRWKGQTTGWLLDRPSRVHLHPGSIFKIVVALAALESANSLDRSPYDPAFRHECRGTFGPVSIDCDGVHGSLDLAASLGRSCNAYFFHLGLERLGPERLFEFGDRLGYGKAPGIDLGGPGGQGRLVPGQLVKTQRGVCEYSIGQVFVEATPIQVLRSIAAIALRGSELPRPYIATPAPAEPLRFENPRAWEVIHDGMWRAGHETGGTAAKPGLGLDRYRAAYKTGTAEVQTASGKLHQAWIVGFAPFEEPRIAFVAVVERTPLHGADACAPIVRAILDRFAADDPAAYLGAEAPGR